MKLDLHTHSILSYDGGITESEYEMLFEKKIIDIAAITDHGEIDLAQRLHKKIGSRIIVGEEIVTSEGELIGLFLKKKIEVGKSIDETIFKIQEQNGLVYIPHPFEKSRSSISESTLDRIMENVDIIEIFNARSFGRKMSVSINDYLKKHEKKIFPAFAVSSDSHGWQGVGRAYSVVGQVPNAQNLSKLLQSGTFQKKYSPFYTYFFPGFNRMKKKFKK